MLKKYIKELWMNEVKYDMLIKMPSSYYSNDIAHKNDVKKKNISMQKNVNAFIHFWDPGKS